MAYFLLYHPEVQKDIARFPRNIKERIHRSIEKRLLVDPIRYGDPLRRDLRGYRKLRVGDYRVIYRIEKETILILKIGHRREVYKQFSV